MFLVSTCLVRRTATGLPGSWFLVLHLRPVLRPRITDEAGSFTPLLRLIHSN